VGCSPNKISKPNNNGGKGRGEKRGVWKPNWHRVHRISMQREEKRKKKQKNGEINRKKNDRSFQALFWSSKKGGQSQRSKLWAVPKTLTRPNLREKKEKEWAKMRKRTI